MFPLPPSGNRTLPPNTPMLPITSEGTDPAVTCQARTRLIGAKFNDRTLLPCRRSLHRLANVSARAFVVLPIHYWCMYVACIPKPREKCDMSLSSQSDFNPCGFQSIHLSLNHAIECILTEARVHLQLKRMAAAVPSSFSSITVSSINCLLLTFIQ